MGAQPLIAWRYIPSSKELFMRSKLSVAFIAVVILGGASTFLTACNTVEGAGKDVSKAGHEVSEEAREHK